MNDIFSLKDKTIIVTGGSTHLGRTISESVAQYGASVIIGSRDVARNTEWASHLSKKYGIDAIGTGLDFTDEESVLGLLALVLGKFNSIDVLINNAAFSMPGKIEEQTYDEFMEGLHGTIGGTYNISKFILQQMQKQKHGNIINISSMYGVVSPNPDLYYGTKNAPNPANYGAGKAAIIQLTKYIACNYAKYNIRCNCIVPGAFPSPAVQQDNKFIDNIRKKNPLNRIGVPEDLKGISVFLSSDASSYITGQSVHVDGGWTIW